VMVDHLEGFNPLQIKTQMTEELRLE
jgi:hypothetical protein